MIGWLMVTGLKILVTQADHNEAIYIYMYLVIYMESNEFYRNILTYLIPHGLCWYYLCYYYIVFFLTQQLYC